MSELMDLTKKRQQDVSELMGEILQLGVEMSDQQVRGFLSAFYRNNYEGKLFTREQKITLLSGFGQVREGYSWFIGDILVDIEAAINRGEYGDILTLGAFHTEYEAELGFSRDTMYSCRNIRINFPRFDDFLSIGIKKARILATVKEPEVFNKLMNEVKKKELTAEQTRDLVAEFKFEAKREKDETRETERKKVLKQYKYDVLISGKKIILQAKNFDAELLESALNYYEPQIKSYIAREDKN